jgi:predicted DNA-binding protein
MPTSVRLDARTEGLVRRLAKKAGRTKSQVIRDAIERLAGADKEERRGPFEAIKHW